LEQRQVGNTSVAVSCLGFGGGAFAGLLVRGEAEEQARCIGRALDAGLTYFDTAAQYGDGLSEESLGRALAAAGAGSRAVVGTKVRMTPAELQDPGPAMRASLQASLRRLRRDHVDAFVLHNFPRPTTERDGVTTGLLPQIAAEMRDLQREGLVRSIGLTGVGETASLHEAVGTGLFDFVQCYFNVLNPSAMHAGAAGGGQDFEGLAAAALAQGGAVMGVRTVAGGALVAGDYRAPLAGPTGNGRGLGGSPYADDLERARRLQPLVDSLGLESPLELGIRFVTSHPGIATALIGFSDYAQLEDALRWVERGALPADVLDQAVELARQTG
jgi:aryl-alcohol dehydrogenase-like predicted oxidoreductase